MIRIVIGIALLTIVFPHPMCAQRDTLSDSIDERCSTISEETARKDIEQGIPKLYFSSGIAGYRFTTSDRIFEIDYRLKFVDLGCFDPPSGCVENYNRIIKRYLDNKYGFVWRKRVTVPYFKEGDH